MNQLLKQKAALKTSDSVVSAKAATLDATISPTRGIYIGGAGDLTVTGSDGVDYTMIAPATGYWHPMVVTCVKSSSKATNILVGY